MKAIGRPCFWLNFRVRRGDGKLLVELRDFSQTSAREVDLSISEITIATPGIQDGGRTGGPVDIIVKKAS